jgi:hypothetical protein
MANGKGAKRETKSDFLRKVLARKPDLDAHSVNLLWTTAGHAGEISTALYYQVRAKLGIKRQRQWTWVAKPEARATSTAPRAPRGRPARPQPKPATGEVYQFKITLIDSHPPIWRRFQVLDCTVDKLHEHIQTAMGWTNSHLHQFTIKGRLYGDPMLMEETFEELNYADSTSTMLHEIVPENGARFRFEYEYDFGDSWNHEVLFEGRPRRDPEQAYPLCLEGARSCPPEDVGGMGGYQDFLAALADPGREDHEQMRMWIALGRRFNPDAFRPAAATNRMKRGLRDWRSLPF